MVFEIIDMHMHLCRDVQQEKTVFPKPGWPDEWYWCNGERIGQHMDQHHISKILSVNVIDHHAMFDRRIRLARQQGASDADIERARVELAEDMRHRVQDLNDWTLALHARDPRVDVYASLDPVLFGAGTMDELERCLKAGAIGVKVHPPIYMHHPDHPEMMKVYERCQELGLGLVTDTASRKSRDGVAYGEPLGWRPVLKAFPHLKLIQAHLCGDRWDDQLDLGREFPDNLFFDFSGGWVDETHPAGIHTAMPITEAVRTFRKVGIPRIMFASSSGPGADDGLDEVRQLFRLPFTDDEKEQLLAGNAKRFLGPQ